MADDMNITLVNAASGQSETLPVQPSTVVSDVADLAKALFGFEADDVNLFKDGQPLRPTLPLNAAGIRSGDVIAVQKKATAPPPAARPRAAPAGGLDFSSLLAQVPAASAATVGNSNNNNGSTTTPPVPVYYPGMSVEDAMEYNPHPHTFVTLLQSKDHLFKELRYHNPQLAAKLAGQSHAQAVQIWRDDMVRGGIASAVRQTTEYHQREQMTRRLQADPNDAEAAQYFRNQENKKRVQQQYLQMMQEYPESLGRVLMLYVDAKINGHPIQAFCDSGAESTIMSKRVARECGLLDLVDDRFHGMATGVGTSKIMGRVHVVQLQIGSSFFPCTITVMDDPPPGAKEMPFLLGLDMMKRHLCQIDLQAGVLRFPMAGTTVPFLHEKDLYEEQGGTKDFDADKSNRDLEEAQKKREEEKEAAAKDGQKKDGGDNGDDKMAEG